MAQFGGQLDARKGSLTVQDLHITVPLIKNGRHQPTETVFAAFQVLSLQFPSAPKLDLGTSAFTMWSIEPYVESNIQYIRYSYIVFSI